MAEISTDQPRAPLLYSCGLRSPGHELMGLRIGFLPNEVKEKIYTFVSFIPLVITKQQTKLKVIHKLWEMQRTSLLCAFSSLFSLTVGEVLTRCCSSSLMKVFFTFIFYKSKKKWELVGMSPSPVGTVAGLEVRRLLWLEGAWCMGSGEGLPRWRGRSLPTSGTHSGGDSCRQHGFWSFLRMQQSFKKNIVL